MLPKRYSALAELALIVGMAATLAVPSALDNIRPWYEISIALYIRAAFWIMGLVALPGLYAFRIGGLLRNQNAIIRFTLSSILSFALVGTVTMVYYSIAGTLSYLPFIFLAMVAGLALLSWRLRGLPAPSLPKRLTKSQILLLVAAVATIAVAVVVQSNWRYLIYTDFWTSLYSGIKIAFGRDVYSAYLQTEYPVAYGYIIAGISAAAGTPIVNTQALMLPLIALNALVFYTLVRALFGLSERVAALGSLIYVFGGGLGWVFNLISRGVIPFIPLSGMLKDMYFFPPFWDQIAFQYKLLALLLALSSLVLFSLSLRTDQKEGRRWAVLSVLSALLFVWAFLIHMLPGFLAPLFVAVALFSGQRGLKLKSLVVLIVSGFALLLACDLLMGGIYVSLILDKVPSLMSGLSTNQLIVLGAVSIGGAALLTVGYYGYIYWRSRQRTVPEATEGAREEAPAGTIPHSRPPILKTIIVAALACLYIVGVFFVPLTTFALDIQAPFPWYSFATRYGFLGALALVGLATSKWNSSWMKIVAFWSALAIILGSVWWGERLNAFLFPVVSLLAAVGTINILRRAYPHLLELRSKANLSGFKWLGASAAVIALIGLSFGSLAVGVYWHATLAEQTSDGMAATLNWIGDNVPEGDKVIVDTSVHPELFGVLHLTDHGILDSATAATTMGDNIFEQMAYLENESVGWVMVNDSLPALSGTTDLVQGFQHYGDMEFESGQFSVRSIPQLNAPSAVGDIAVVNKGYLGLSQLENTFVWADDRMSDWIMKNGQFYTDGEVMTMEWNSTADNQTGPWAYVDIPQFSASAYPWLIIHYRNTAETTATNATITQYARVGLSSSNASTIAAPLPISSEYRLVYLRLPSNLNVNRAIFQIANTSSLNGTVGLEIDFIGFSKSAPVYSTANPYFLSAVLPALWPANYTVYNDFNVGSESILVTTYHSSINEEVAPLQNVTTVILFNNALFKPSWGEGWTPLSSGVLSGTYQGKRYIMVSAGAEEIVGHLSEFSGRLYADIG